MTKESKQLERRGARALHGSGLGTSSPARGPVSCEPSAAPTPPIAAPATFEEALNAVIALAQATMGEGSGRIVSEQPAQSPRASRAHANDGSSHQVGSSHSHQVGSSHSRGAEARRTPLTAQQQLAKALRGLEPERALKVRTLMVAGRDGQSIHAVKIHMTLADSVASFHAAADDTSENGPLLAEYLRRGHALAHASGLDLERPLSVWAKADVGLDERDWQRFGRQLAQSHPDDWHCLLLGGDVPDHGGQLYLQHPQHGSWSFHAQLARTEGAATLAGASSVDGQRRPLALAGSSAIATRSLSALAPRLRKTQGLALGRAARAICARVGAAAAQR